MSELTLWRIVRRGFLYLGISLAVLAVFFVIIVLSKGAQISGGWIGLVVYTSGLFWVMIRRSRDYWRRPMFWLTVVSLMAVHSLAFVAILRSYPQWRMVWFAPVIIVEGVLIGMLLDTLFGGRAK